jgi:hypothetical protein
LDEEWGRRRGVSERLHVILGKCTFIFKLKNFKVALGHAVCY